MSFPIFVLLTSLIAVGTVVASALLAKQRWLALAVGAAGATALLLFIGPGYFNCFFDDSYITFRYSQHLADGLGPNWNSAGRVEGYTSFSWMGIMAAMIKLDLDPVTTSQVLGLIALLGTFFFVERIWSLWARDDEEGGLASPVLPVAVFVGIALTDGTNFWGFSGMETPLFTAAITGSAWLYLREMRSPGIAPWSAVAFAAAAMTRPEGLIVAAVTGAFVIGDAVLATNRRQALIRAGLWWGVFLLLYGSYFLWRTSYYDHTFPNTYYAKAGATRATIERGLTYIWNFGLRYQFIALFGGIALLAWRPRLRRDAIYLITLCGAMLFAVAMEGGDAYPHGRFIMPVLPLLYLGGLAGLATVVRSVAQDATRTVAVTSAVLVLGAMSLYPGLHEEILCRNADDLHQREVLGDWLTDNAPEDFRIAAYAVGALGYYADRDMVDLLGINDVTIAHTEISGFGSGLAGHEKYNTDYVFDVARPEIIIPSDAEPGPKTEQELRATFAVPSPIRARNAYLVDPRLYDQYVVRSLQTNGYWFNFFQRADTVDELQSPDLSEPH